MKNNFSQEIIISLVLVILLVFLLNPFNFLMPNSVLIMAVISLIVVFVIFASFIWREDAKDEREVLHRMFAGRIAYLVGTGVLVLGVIFQSFKHEVDWWIVVTLGLMVLAKIGGIIYSRTKN